VPGLRSDRSINIVPRPNAVVAGVDMQVSVESLGNLERRMTFSLPAERLEAVVGGRLREISRGAKIKGFRPGKIPQR
jgi:hypothetical protein